MKPKSYSGNCAIIVIVVAAIFFYISSSTGKSYKEERKERAKRDDKVKAERLLREKMDRERGIKPKRKPKIGELKKLSNRSWLVHENYIGDKWPLAVESCQITIVDANRFIYVMTVRSFNYAINGRSYKKYKQMRSNNRFWRKHDDGTNYSLDPLIQFANEKCKYLQKK